MLKVARTVVVSTTISRAAVSPTVTAGLAGVALPAEATSYVARVEDYVRVPVALVSVGAERTATFSRLAIWEGI